MKSLLIKDTIPMFKKSDRRPFGKYSSAID